MIQGTIDTRPLAPALSGERREIDSGAAGRLSFYCDRPAAREGTAVPLLLIHSVNAAASAYEVRPLYQHYRAVRPVYALDLPGYGFSSREDRPYTPGLMTGAVLAMVSEIRREHEGAALDALAISLSCEFLARAATETPGAFRSLALVNPTGFNRRALREGVRESTLGRARVRTLLRSPRWRRGIFDLLTRRGVIRYFLRRTYGSARIDAGLAEYDYQTARVPGAENAPLDFLSGYLFSGDSGTLYRSLAMPVWVPHGTRGDFGNFRGLEQLLDRPNWTEESFETGALPHFEKPAEFIASYDEWLGSLRARPGVGAVSHIELPMPDLE